MSDFAARLREARERRGVSLRDIAAHTRFSTAAFEALERNDPSRLPDGIFARAFVRSCAAEVGLDPEASVREYVESFDIEPPILVVDLSQLHVTRRSADSRSRLSPTILTPVVVSLMAMAIIFHVTRARGTEESSGDAGCSTDQPAHRFSCSEKQRAAVSSEDAALSGVHRMDPGYRSPLIDMFRRDSSRETRLLAAQGDLGAAAHDQLALLMLLIDDADPDVALTALSTVQRLPREPLRAFLARADVPPEIREFFAGMGITPAEVAAADASAPLTGGEDDEDEEGAQEDETKEGAKTEPKILAGLPIKKKIRLASKGTREQRAQLIRDPNKLVAGAVLSSPKLTDAEVESFAKMANVAEEVLRVIGTNRTWLKNYGVTLGLVKNPKTPPAISMQLLQRINERDMKMLAVDRNVPEALRLAARKFIVKGLK